MPRKPPGVPRKQRINLTLDPDILGWIRKSVGPGKRFASVTHGIEFAVSRLMESEAKPPSAPGPSR